MLEKNDQRESLIFGQALENYKNNPNKKQSVLFWQLH